jgi:hypothetical protein
MATSQRFMDHWEDGTSIGIDDFLCDGAKFNACPFAAADLNRSFKDLHMAPCPSQLFNLHLRVKEKHLIHMLYPNTFRIRYHICQFFERIESNSAT